MFSVTKLKAASATLQHTQTQIERIRDLFDDEDTASRLDRIATLIERERVALEREIDACEGKNAA